MEVKKEIIFFIISLFFINLVCALSPPALPDHFKGNLIVDDKTADIGTEIKIYVEDNLENTIKTTMIGKYDLYVKTGNNGDEIKFKVNDILAETYTRKGGKTINLDLYVWTDRDNDDINDSNDKLIGDSNSVNDNFDNLGVLVDGSTNILGSFNGIKNIEFKDNDKNIISFSFDFDSNILNLFNLEIKKQSNDEGSILVKGMPSNVVKTVYVDKLKSSSNAVCVLDEEITSISEISSDCSNGIKINCPGNNGDYSCYAEENRFKITGLKHSGVKEFYIAPPSSPPSSGGSSGGGGGGGGGGGTPNINDNVVQPVLPVLNLFKKTEEIKENPEEKKIGENGGGMSGVTGAVIGTKQKINWVWIIIGVGIIAVLLVTIKLLAFKRRDY